MEQYDSYFLQALATTALITALDNPDLKDDLFQILKFNNDSFKNIIKLSGIGNPATLQMFLYALLVAPYEMNKEHKLNMEFEKLNQFINKYIIDSQSNYSYDKNEINYIRHIRNSISHSKCNFFTENKNDFITFLDQDNSHGNSYKCDFTIRTADVGKLLEKIQLIILNYFQNKYPEKCI